MKNGLLLAEHNLHYGKCSLKIRKSVYENQKCQEELTVTRKKGLEDKNGGVEITGKCNFLQDGTIP